MPAFEVNLTNQGKMVWLALGFTILFTATMVGGIIALQGRSAVVTYTVLIGVGTCLSGALFVLIKRFLIEPSIINVADDRITVLTRASGKEIELLFKNIVSYRYFVYDKGKELRLKQTNSTVLRLSDKSEAFAAMVREFEAALGRNQPRGVAPLPKTLLGNSQATETIRVNLVPPIALREKTFFENRIATVVMVALSVILVWLTCSVILSSRPIKGSLFLACSGYISYAVSWWVTRKQRII